MIFPTKKLTLQAQYEAGETSFILVFDIKKFLHKGRIFHVEADGIPSASAGSLRDCFRHVRIPFLAIKKSLDKREIFHGEP